MSRRDSFVVHDAANEQIQFNANTPNQSYDANGNLNRFTDRKNQVTSFTYDALNRRVGASYGDGSHTTFTYDAGAEKGDRLLCL